MPISLKKVSLIFLTAIVLVGVGVLLWNRMNSETSSQGLIVSVQEDTTVSPTQAPVLKEVSEVHSPDGKMNLVMEKVTQGDSTEYTVSVSDIPKTTQETIYTKTLPNGQSLALSDNSWSPNNTYFFVKELGAGSSPSVYVFNADGEAFSDGRPYVDVLPGFNAKGTGNDLTDVTGWDANTLLHVFTSAQGGGKGPTYWFEIPSGAVIQLAGR